MSYPIPRLNIAPVGHMALLLASLLLLPLGCVGDDPTDPGGDGDDLTDPGGRLVLLLNGASRDQVARNKMTR